MIRGIAGTVVAALVQPPSRGFTLTQKAVETPLPRQLTIEYLRGLGVPNAALPILIRCATEEALLEAPVAPEAMNRVLDALYPRGTSSASCFALTRSSAA